MLVVHEARELVTRMASMHHVTCRMAGVGFRSLAIIENGREGEGIDTHECPVGIPTAKGHPNPFKGNEGPPFNNVQNKPESLEKWRFT